MRDPIAKAEQELLSAASRLEVVARRLWPVASRLELAAGEDPDLLGLAGLVGAVLVDRLHPAIDALRSAIPSELPMGAASGSRKR